MNDNKLILKNTIIIYLRMIIVTIVGLYSSRFILQALGVSDFGLYSVVGGLIGMLNFISASMGTTTRRFLNIEMGKQDGNLNKVFNICLLLHILFALLILVVAETIGIWFINNVLNVDPGKEGDAMFIFQISTFVACLGIVNIPYQSLIEANERFFQAAIIDILTTFLKFGFVIYLIFYDGNALRFYAVSVCIVTFISFLLYQYYCHKSWSDVVKFKCYMDYAFYKEILIFNNLTAVGAASSLGRSQGSTLLINYFFGTIVNAAYAIASQVESYIYIFAVKITLASNPQLAKNFSSGNTERAFFLAEKNSRYSILIMTVIFFAFIPEVDFILKIWLKEVPAGTSLFCVLTMVNALIKSFIEGTNGYIQASGKIKWFQYITSLMLLLNLPIGYILFKLEFKSYWILISYIFTTFLSRIITLWLMKRILGFPVIAFIRKAYLRPVGVILILSFLYILFKYNNIVPFDNGFYGIVLFFVASCLISFLVGLTASERTKALQAILRK